MKHLFFDPITIYSEESIDEYGRRSYGTGTAVTGRAIEKTKTLFDAKGEAIQADLVVYLPAGTSISIGSRVKYDSTNYKVVKVEKPKDYTKVKFVKGYGVIDNA